MNTNTAQLPQPDEVSEAHSQRVIEHIGQIIIDAGGSIGFAEFMQHALYANELGYYSAGSVKFGATGDFVTAPEISPLFGKILANQVATALGPNGGAGQQTVLEIGAGSGALAVDLLRRLELLGSLPCRYSILEISADLQQRQLATIQSALPHLVEKVAWLGALPKRMSGVVVANEVADALPVERFVKRSGKVKQLTVTFDDGVFAWGEQPAPKILSAAVQDIETELGVSLPDGYTSEVSLGVGGWIADIADSLDRGFVFLFDYGVSQREYYAAHRSDGWLRCHFRHRAHNNPLILAGIQDLTAWVNFSQVANAAYDNGMHIAGWVNQAQFMLLGGLATELENMAGLPTDAQIALSRQVKSLTMPGEMGENFKCLGLSKGAVDVPELFALADRSHTL